MSVIDERDNSVKLQLDWCRLNVSESYSMMYHAPSPNTPFSGYISLNIYI